MKRMFIPALMACASALASVAVVAQERTGHVWIQPDQGAPRAFGLPDWGEYAKASGGVISVVDESGGETPISASGFSLLLVNNGAGSLASGQTEPAVSTGPAFSLVGFSSLGLDGQDAPQIQITPSGGALVETTPVSIRAIARSGDTSPIEMRLRLSCSDGAQLDPRCAEYASFKRLLRDDPDGSGTIGTTLSLVFDGQYQIEVEASQSTKTSPVRTVTLTLKAEQSPFERDSDGDGIPDAFELLLGLDPSNGDQTTDRDDDGWSDLDELLRGTDPNDPNSSPIDTDQDGWSDYDEIHFRGTDHEDLRGVYSETPTADRLYEVEYRLGGGFFKDVNASVSAAPLEHLTAVDPLGRVRFDQDTLPSADRGFFLLEAQVALWFRSDLFRRDLELGQLPREASVNVMRLPGGMPLLLRARQRVIDMFGQPVPGPHVPLAWIGGADDARPASSNCTATLSAEDKQSPEAWLDCYRAYLAQTLVRDVDSQKGLNPGETVPRAFTPTDGLMSAYFGSLIEWMALPAPEGAERLFLPSNPDHPIDSEAARRVLAAMPGTEPALAYAELQRRLTGLSAVPGRLAGLAAMIVDAVEADLAGGPETTTEGYVAQLLRAATIEEQTIIRLALVSAVWPVNLDPAADIDGDGLSTAQELANGFSYTSPDRADSDGDGMFDAQDPCPQDLTQSCLPSSGVDTDADGVVDALDNCPDDFNPDQLDTVSHPEINGGAGADDVGDACSSRLLAAIVAPGADIRVQVGYPVRFEGRVTEAAGADIASVALNWDFGSGVAPGSQLNETRSFDVPGMRSVTLKASSVGGDSTDTVVIEVLGTAMPTRALLLGDDVVVAEREGVAVVQYTLSTAVAMDVVLDVQTQDGSAVSPTDYTATTTRITIPAGELASPSVPVQIAADSVTEGNESFSVAVQIVSGPADVDRAPTSVTILDGDGRPNAAPVAIDDELIVDEDADVTEVQVLANDTDADGDSLVITSLGDPSNEAAGSFENRGDRIAFVPTVNVHGAVSIPYTVSDGRGGSDTATLTVIVNSINDAPDAQDESYSLDEDAASASYEVLANDEDVDGDTLRILSVTPFTAGTNVSISADGLSLIYQPSPNFVGTELVSYTVGDGGDGQDTATVTFIVGGFNDNPVAVDDFHTMLEDAEPAIISVLANDSDVDGNALSLDGIGVPTNPDAGEFSVLGNDVVFSPAEHFNGLVNVTYRVNDGFGGSDEGLLTVSVTAVNDAPIAQDDPLSVNEDASATLIDVLGNDSDVDGDALQISAVTAPDQGGTALISEGKLSYTPAGNFSGEETFSYTIIDGNGGLDTATVRITVGGVNDNPVAQDDRYDLFEDGALAILDVLANDTDADGDELTITGFTVLSESEDPGTVENLGNSLSFTPGGNFNGELQITYTVEDGMGGSDSAIARVFVMAVNDAPTAVSDAASTQVEMQVAIDVLANDRDVDGDAVFLQGVDDTTEQGGRALLSPTAPVVIYQPPAGFVGVDRFSYTIRDGEGLIATAMVEVTVSQAPNLAPIANADSAVARSGQTVIIDVLANDSDPEDGALVIRSVTQGTSPATISIVGGSQIAYTAPSGFNGQDSFSYTIEDPQGAEDSAVVTVEVAANSAPVAASDSSTVAEDTVSPPIDVIANDTDADGDTLTLVSAVVVSGSGAVVPQGDNRSLVVAPAANYFGPLTVSYQVSDGIGGTATGQLVVTVTPVPDAPVAVNDNFDVIEDGGQVILAVRANDSDADNDALTVTAFANESDPGNVGVFSISAGNLRIAPASNQFGTLSVDYTVRDPSGLTDTARVTVNVLPRNDAPEFAAGPGQCAAADGGEVVVPNWATAISVGPVDEAEQNRLFLVTSNSNPGVFAVAPSVSPEGELRFMPAPGSEGLANLSIVLKDDGGTDNGGADTSTERSLSVLVQRDRSSPSVCLSLLDGADGVIVRGATANEAIGHVVRPIGDFNGDGRPDLAIGGFGASFGGTGPAYLMFGSAGAASSPQAVSGLTAITGIYSRNRPVPVDGVGDVNVDSLDDMVIGEPDGASGSEVGAVRVLFGRSGFVPGTALDASSGTAQLVIHGRVSAEESSLGLDAGGIGDVNGDGTPDIGALAIRGPGGTSSVNGMRAYVIYGGEALATLDGADGAVDGVAQIANLTAETGYIVDSELKDSGLPIGTYERALIRGLGRFNGDAVDDFAISMPAADVTTSGGDGRVMVVFGSTANRAALSDTVRDGTNVLVIDGTGTNQAWGRNLAAGADLNGDGFNDLASSRNNTDDISVVYGRADFAATGGQVSLASLSAAQGLRLRCTETNCAIGGLAFLEDVNGDGNADLAVPRFQVPNQYGLATAGTLQIVFGGATQLGLADADDDVTDGIVELSTLSADRGQLINGRINGGNLARGPEGVASVGDMDGDGSPDIAIGAPLIDAPGGSPINVGEVYVLYGHR